MSKKIKNLGEYDTSKEAYDQAFALSNTLNNAIKRTGKPHSMKVERSGKKHILWLIQD